MSGYGMLDALIELRIVSVLCSEKTIKYTIRLREIMGPRGCPSNNAQHWVYGERDE